MASHLEEQFLIFLKAQFPVMLRTLQREYKFHKARKWRFDFAWPELKLAVEIEGGVWGNGRHNRAMGFISDCDKYNSAILEGWSVFRFTESHLNDLSAIKTLEDYLSLHQIIYI